MMNEDFLHYLWKFKLLHFNDLKTEDHQNIQIISQGFHNTDAGPDFLNARIKIGDTLWAGHIEIHLKASDWHLHKHHHDKKYDNVILHVVHDNDMPVFRTNSTPIATLCIKNKYDENLLSRYKSLLANKAWVPCENLLPAIGKTVINIWKEKLVIERLLRKANDIELMWTNCKNDWEQVFYEVLCRNFGFKINATAFDMLAKSLPVKYLAKHKDSALQVEALLFGQAGLLDIQTPDDYSKALTKEYLFLKNKYSLHPIDKSLWNFLRVRPQNAPHVRIAQLSALLQTKPALFSYIIETEQYENMMGLFDVKASEYWSTHFNFSKTTHVKSTNLGKTSVESIIINTVVPVLFAYGNSRKNTVLKEKALALLEHIPPETNTIVKHWNERRLSARSAYDTQALIELKNCYCNYKKCLSCMIGDRILQNRT